MHSCKPRRVAPTIRSHCSTLAALTVFALAGCGSLEATNPECLVRDLALTPDTTSVAVGGSVTFQVAIEETGCDNPRIFWSSSDAAVASVTQGGVVAGLSIGGPATIAASVMGRSAIATVRVVDVPVASVEVAGSQSVVVAGRTLQLTATARDASGNPLKGRSFTWSSSDPTVASISASALVTGIDAGGSVTITASAGGQSGTVRIAVVGRMAYAVVADPAAPASTPVAATSYNSSALPITVTRSGHGAHTVTFFGLGTRAGRSETVIVNAVGSAPAACVVTGWSSAGANLSVGVACGSTSGARQDTPFSLLVLGDDMLGGRTAFARAHNATANVPYAPAAAVSHNPSGQGIVITRTGTGRYDVSFTGNGRAAGSLPETILISAFADAAALCQVAGWSPSKAIVSVRCSDALGVPRNSPFTIALVERGRAGRRAAYTMADCTGLAGCTTDASLTHSTGGAITVTRTAPGAYQATFADLARLSPATDAVFVTAATGAHCAVVAWANALNGRDLQATIQCRGLGLGLNDASFDILLID